jgi:adenylate cyclase
VDKYIGDSIMAFWGAPLPDEEHAARACRAALLCRERLKVLNKKWAAAGKVALPTRMGISTGETVVGNVGSSERINYTVMGDNVNLASRLEGVNRLYGTQILVNRTTYEQVAEEFWFRPVDLIKVKGKSIETTVYELMGGKGDEEEMDYLAWFCRDFTLGFEAYKNRDFAGGEAIFGRLSKKFPSDGLAALYLKRCRRLQEHPPGADWRGVTFLESK